MMVFSLTSFKKKGQTLRPAPSTIAYTDTAFDEGRVHIEAIPSPLLSILAMQAIYY